MWSIDTVVNISWPRADIQISLGMAMETALIVASS